MRRFLTVLAALATLSLTNCGYNAIQTNDEQVKANWSEVVNQYQRRADLVPNLVNSVKGFAQQEQDVLIGVTQARAKVGSIQATPEVLNDPAAFQKFTQAQGELTSALQRLLVVTENYPQLKSDALFHDLMSQLEGTENRITVARNRYIKSVQDYNVTIRSIPTNLTAMAFGYKEKPNFTVENEKEISTAPKVDFNLAPAEVGQNACRVRDLAQPRPCCLRCSCAGRRRRSPRSRCRRWSAVWSTRLTRSTASYIETLNQRIRSFEQRKGSQIAVLIVPTTQPETIEQYSIRAADAWKIGRKKIDDGALLVIAKNDHKLRIEVGYGLEGALTDVTARRIIDEVIAPHFKTGDFAGGISEGLTRMIGVIDGERLPSPAPEASHGPDVDWMRCLQSGFFPSSAPCSSAASCAHCSAACSDRAWPAAWSR